MCSAELPMVSENKLTDQIDLIEIFEMYWVQFSNLIAEIVL